MSRRGRKPGYKWAALLAAVRDCLENGVGVREAARLHGVSPATLSRHLISLRKEALKKMEEQALTSLEDRLAGLEDRLGELEEQLPALGSLPSRKEVETMIGSLGDAVKATLDELKGAREAPPAESREVPSSSELESPNSDLADRLARLERDFHHFKLAMMRTHSAEGLKPLRSGGLAHTKIYTPDQIDRAREEWQSGQGEE